MHRRVCAPLNVYWGQSVAPKLDACRWWLMVMLVDGDGDDDGGDGGDDDNNNGGVALTNSPIQ